MKNIKKIMLVALFLSLGATIISCNKKVKYAVTFNANGGQLNSEEVVYVISGSNLEKPNDPTKSGYKFISWYTSSDDGLTLDEKWEFANFEVLKQMTLYAKWEKEEIQMVGYESFLDDKNPEVTIVVKDFGTMKVQLFPSVAENTVNNFIKYVEDNKYAGSSFHRVIAGFMIQGGQVNSTNKPIKGEFVNNGVNNLLKHDRGVISMARTNVFDSATSQFFIMHDVASYLDKDYAAFGVLVEGFDVLDKIAIVKTSGYPYDAPLTQIIIENVTVNLKGYAPKEVIYN